jgi:imidazolonepropionase-like amidohydrolase
MEYEPDQARRIADAGLYVCPTIFAGKGKFMDPAEADTSPEVADFFKQRQDRLTLVRYLIEDGVQLVSGNDAGVTFNAFDAYPGDLILAAEGADLSPVYVLKTATSVAAEALGRSDLGVISPGKAADLLGVHGNPLQDIRDIKNTQLVIARGQVIRA